MHCQKLPLRLAARAEAHGVAQAGVRHVLVAELPRVGEVHPRVPSRVLDLDVAADPRAVSFAAAAGAGPADDAADASADASALRTVSKSVTRASICARAALSVSVCTPGLLCILRYKASS